MTVYVVFGYSEWSGNYEVIKVCATEELAEEVISKVEEDETYDNDDIWWEVYQVKE